ncbi:MAG: aldo/keto reductase [Spirochaetales bacterium]|nr:aldo/keto reductase [Spirochaetales bacterium]
MGLGCWQFSGGKGISGSYWQKLNQEDVQEIISISLKAGINWFDTAEVYGWGNSERSLAAGLKGLGIKPGDVVIASKWFPLMRTARSIINTFPARSVCLGEYDIDLYQIHLPGSFSRISTQMQRMADLLEQHKIKAIGVSNFNARQMIVAHETLAKRGMVLASNQMRYSLLNRDIEKNGVLAAAKELGITIIAYSPLAQGLLSGKFHEHPEEIKSRPGPRKFLKQFKSKNIEKTRPLIELLKKIADKKGKSPAQIALSWLINRHGDSIVAIPGASKPKHAETNAQVLSIKFKASEIEELDSLSTRILGN